MVHYVFQAIKKIEYVGWTFWPEKYEQTPNFATVTNLVVTKHSSEMVLFVNYGKSYLSFGVIPKTKSWEKTLALSR